LVAPIYLHGLPVRKVVLPKGKWFNFWTNEAHDGSKTIFDNVTLDNIPVYAKAGGIVPLATSWKNNTEQYTNDSLTVKFFQDISVRNSSFSMYHDDGKDPKAIENQQFEIIDFLGKTYTDSVVFESVRKNTFAKGLANRAIALEIINVANYPRGVRINNRAIQLVTKTEDFRGTDIAYYSFDERVVRVRYAWNCAVPAKVVLQRDGTAAPTSSEPKLLSNDDLVIYPSPVARQGLVNVQTPIVESGVYQITVFDTNGKIVYEQNLGKIQQGQSLSHSFGVGDSVGTLLINIQNEKGSTMSGKFLVK
jgi:oligosaccharide 4-alpha-D-glucosyltransferase